MLRFAVIEALEADAAPLQKAGDAADELLRVGPVAAQRHLDRWLGGRQEFVKA